MSPFTSFAVTFALATSACIVQTVPPPPFEGSVVFDWTVNRTTDPEQCRLAGADAFAVTIFDDRDRAIGTFDAPCASFATSIVLDEGRYSAEAWLIDSYGHARTTTINVVPFTVFRDTSIDIPLDFPAQSFY